MMTVRKVLLVAAMAFGLVALGSAQNATIPINGSTGSGGNSTAPGNNTAPGNGTAPGNNTAPIAEICVTGDACSIKPCSPFATECLLQNVSSTYPEGYTCGTCMDGYAGDGKLCLPGANPCMKLNTCGAEHCTYNNATQNVTCGCPVGMTGVGVPAGEPCVNINECAMNNGGCGAALQCFDSTPSEANQQLRFSCGVNPVLGAGKTCADKPCSPFAKCVDASSSAGNGNATAGNSTATGNSTASGNSTDSGAGNSTASGNTTSSYTCTCNTGYFGDGKYCVAENKCLDGNNGGCGDRHCMWVKGSVRCGACRTGYTGVGAATGFKCVNINECAVDNGGCGVNVTCVDYTPRASNNQTRFECVNGTETTTFGSWALSNCTGAANRTDTKPGSAPVPDDEDNGCWYDEDDEQHSNSSSSSTGGSSSSSSSSTGVSRSSSSSSTGGSPLPYPPRLSSTGMVNNTVNVNGAHASAPISSIAVISSLAFLFVASWAFLAK